MSSFKLLALFIAMTPVMMSESKPSAAPSSKLLSFMAVVSKHSSTQGEADQDKAFGRPVHDVLDVSCIPVSVPVLDDRFTLLLIEKDNGTINRFLVAAASEDLDGNIRLRLYNVTNEEKIRLDGPKPPSQLDLQPGELLEHQECEVVLVGLETNVFYGLWPDCRDSPLESLLNYEVVFTCNGIGVIMHNGMQERVNDVPYVHRIVNRYPLLPEMLEGVKNYVDPCTCA